MTPAPYDPMRPLPEFSRAAKRPIAEAAARSLRDKPRARPAPDKLKEIRYERRLLKSRLRYDYSARSAWADENWRFCMTNARCEIDRAVRARRGALLMAPADQYVREARRWLREARRFRRAA